MGEIPTGGTRAPDVQFAAVRPLPSATARSSCPSRAGNAEIFAQIGPRQGMSGVFDHATGTFLLRPSTTATPLPPGAVAQYGGHAAVRADLGLALGEDLSSAAPGRLSGFSLSRAGDNSITFGWNSGVINPGSHGTRAVPEALRSSIEAAVRESLGL